MSRQWVAQGNDKPCGRSRTAPQGWQYARSIWNSSGDDSGGSTGIWAPSQAMAAEALGRTRWARLRDLRLLIETAVKGPSASIRAGLDTAMPACCHFATCR